MISSDAPNVLSILQESPEASLWPENGILESASHGMAWVAEQDGGVAGFLIGRVVADEFEILNMAVARAYRRRGIGGQLVRQALESSRMAGAKQAHLEVRASNEGAISLYMRYGFRQYGRRVGYYQFTVEISSMQQ
jgi:ribosomal-protein-alanine N-acetyltransferase